MLLFVPFLLLCRITQHVMTQSTVGQLGCSWLQAIMHSALINMIVDILMMRCSHFVLDTQEKSVRGHRLCHISSTLVDLVEYSLGYIHIVPITSLAA